MYYYYKRRTVKWLFLLPLPDVISWQDFRISKGPPAWLQSAFLLILFFWRTVSQNRTEKYNSYCSHYRGWTDTQQVILITLCWNKFNKWQVCPSDFIFHVFLLSLTPSPPSALPLLTCAVWLATVWGEANYFQVGELGGHVVFPSDYQWWRTQIGFVQYQDHMLL